MKNIILLIGVLFSFLEMEANNIVPQFDIETSLPITLKNDISSLDNDTLFTISNFDKIQIPKDLFENELLQKVIECLNKEGNRNLISDMSSNSAIEEINIINTSDAKNKFQINLKFSAQFAMEKEYMLIRFQKAIKENHPRFTYKIIGLRNQVKGMIFKGMWNDESVSVYFD